MSDLPEWLDPAQDALLTPSALRGLAHPIRLQLLDLLQADGPATATSLGQRIEQSTGVTSYHLRLLAEHGFIVEDTERGTGRDRWWKAVHRWTSFTFRMPEDSGTSETVERAENFMRLVAEQSHRRVLDFIATLSGKRDELAEMPWTVSDIPLQLTLDEARELRREMLEIAARYRRDPDHQDARPGTVRAHVGFQLIPENP